MTPTHTSGSSSSFGGGGGGGGGGCKISSDRTLLLAFESASSPGETPVNGVSSSSLFRLRSASEPPVGLSSISMSSSDTSAISVEPPRRLALVAASASPGVDWMVGLSSFWVFLL